MVRLLAFILNADEHLAFGKGLCEDDEPALWLKDLRGDVECWIEVGLPDERRLRKASRKAKKVLVYTYGGQGVDVWWSQQKQALSQIANLQVFRFSQATTTALAEWVQRSIQCQASIQDGELWLTCGETSISVEILKL